MHKECQNFSVDYTWHGPYIEWSPMQSYVEYHITNLSCVYHAIKKMLKLIIDDLLLKSIFETNAKIGHLAAYSLKHRVFCVSNMGNAKEKTLIPPCHPLFLKKIGFY